MLVRAALPLVLGGGLYTAVLAFYALNPGTTTVGYAPVQPVEYSHALHAGELGIDCRYCHTTVEHAGFAAVPPTQVCMGCHVHIHPESELLAPVQASFRTGLPIEWIKVHDLPDHAYFDHAAHINKGVSCIECHGRVDKMEIVEQVESLSMAWCLDCHRNPGPRLRPVEYVTDMDWHPPVGEEREAQIRYLLEFYEIKSVRQLTDCSTCHR